MILKEFAQCIENELDDQSAFQYLIQRISVAIQRGSAVSVLGRLGWPLLLLGFRY